MKPFQAFGRLTLRVSHVTSAALTYWGTPHERAGQLHGSRRPTEGSGPALGRRLHKPRRVRLPRLPLARRPACRAPSSTSRGGNGQASWPTGRGACVVSEGLRCAVSGGVTPGRALPCERCRASGCGAGGSRLAVPVLPCQPCRICVLALSCPPCLAGGSCLGAGLSCQRLAPCRASAAVRALPCERCRASAVAPVAAPALPALSCSRLVPACRPCPASGPHLAARTLPPAPCRTSPAARALPVTARRGPTAWSPPTHPSTREERGTPRRLAGRREPCRARGPGPGWEVRRETLRRCARRYRPFGGRQLPGEACDHHDRWV